jgi:hypothetical protein
MYKEHPVFKKPEDENVKIWRYMKFNRFESMLRMKTLFFARLDILVDTFEGTLSKVNCDPNLKRKIMSEGKITEHQFQQNLQNLRKHEEIFNREIRKGVAINCWHIKNYETANMWERYKKEKKEIAIQSTYRRLADSFHEDKENEEFIGCVKYIDHEKESHQSDTIHGHINILDPFSCKQKSYEIDKELRVLILKLPIKEMVIDNKTLTKLNCATAFSGNGLLVPVNLDTLIQKVFVSPEAEEWLYELVKSIVEKYEIKKDVIKSSLADDPIF